MTTDMPPVEPAPAPTKDERMWGMFCHLAALAGYIIPFGHILGPLVVWLVKREEYPFVADQGKEALNFQISITIYGLICIPLVFLAIGILLLIALMVAALVFIVIAAIKANEGTPYRYPLTIRFIK